MKNRTADLMKHAKRLHFVGIGGSGMFPLVEILHREGYEITGSDVNGGSIIDKERALGIPVYIGHDARNIEGADALVVTAALLDGNVEAAAAKQQDIPVIERAELLGYITTTAQKAICISGTHGKTTTTSMLSSILYLAGRDPSLVIGGYLPVIGGYGRRGESGLMVVEACEFKDTFLYTQPYRSVILNIDADHLDYFKTVDNLRASFRKFAQLATGGVVANGDDAPTMLTLAGIQNPVITYGEAPGCDYIITDIVNYDRGFYRFSLTHGDDLIGAFTLHVPGIHNVHNAAAAAVCALLEGLTAAEIQNGFDHFYGAGRRFEILGTFDGVTIADDYAHHPAELSATLDAAQQMGYDRVIAVFQPFTFTRTRLLLDDFAAALSKADLVVMTDIMGSREVDPGNITTDDLAARIPGSVWFKTFGEVVDYTLSIARPGDFILTMGCGDIYKAANMMVEKCKSQTS